MSLRTQRRIAASLLKCGEGRIRIDPNRLDDVEIALTRKDVMRLIKDGTIQKLQKSGVAKRSRRKRPGVKKGGLGKKKRHGIRVEKVRTLRRTIRDLRNAGRLEKDTYRKLYLMIKGGAFKTKKELLRYVEAKELVVE